MRSRWVARALPFIFYILVLIVSEFLSSQGLDVRWLYAMRVGGTALILCWLWKNYAELIDSEFLTQKELLLSILAGLLVFVLWIKLDWAWMALGEGPAYAPTLENGHLNWPMIAIRWAGAALVVPLMEELFWRSFLMRWIDQQDFLAVSPASVSVKALLLSSVLFASEHTFWFAGLIAGLVFGWLYMKTGKLWAPVLAHGVTNGVLGVWVVYTRQWIFW